MLTVNEKRRMRLGYATLLALSSIFFLAIWGVVDRVSHALETERRNLIDEGRSLVESLNREVDVHIYNLMAMKWLAERYLTGKVLCSENPVFRLQPVPEHGGYASALPGSTPSSLAGRLTGLGPVPAPDAPVVQEMAMAVELLPLMRAIRARSPEIPWVYYTSALGFMFLFPEQDAKDFYFKPEQLRSEFIAGVTPKADPQRKTFWSRPHLDAAGKGMILTVSQPIYQGDDFKGSVSIDFSVANLKRALDLHPLPLAGVRLLWQDGEQLASAKAVGDSSGVRQQDVLLLPLKEAPCRLELQINREGLLWSVLRRRAMYIGTVVILGTCLFFTFLLLRSRQRIYEISIRDGLTGLHNRRYFDEIAQTGFDAVRRGTYRLGLALMDVDFFKKYNDRYGHQQGDVALCAVARALKSASRRGSDQVFRVGGEEFALLVLLQEGETLEPLLHKLNQAVRDLQMPHVNNPAGHMTISIGATIISRERLLTVDQAYHRADEALYQAKSAGRDRAVFLPPVGS